MKWFYVIMTVVSVLCLFGYAGAALYFIGWDAVLYGAIAFMWLVNVVLWGGLTAKRSKHITSLDISDKEMDDLIQALAKMEREESMKNHPSRPDGPMGFLR